MPIALGQTNEVLSCYDCNICKSDMTGPEFMAFRQTKKLPATYVEWVEKRMVKRLKL